MRSQASKPSPKKGDSSKTSLKSSSIKKTKKKTVTPKKVKKLVCKSLVKSSKKNISKDDIRSSKTGEDSNADHENETETTETNKPGTSKASSSRGSSPTKKCKKDSKEKKDAIKNISDCNVKKVIPKKLNIKEKKSKIIKTNVKKSEKDNNDVKYKINKGVVKKVTGKFSKAKTIIKKGNTSSNEKKKCATVSKADTSEKEGEAEKKVNKGNHKPSEENKTVEDKVPENTNINTDGSKTNENVESKPILDNSSCKTPPSKIVSCNPVETPKTDTERPPKFFTSVRSPRTVDIDVKCCKNSKGNLSVSERFLSMKLETKTEDSTKEKNAANTLISQGPEIDVYTFTEKVDSPKSILSDFRSPPINKNIGRVRPIARVKGTVIDTKTESEKKKYSPHKPIEEVVKLLKANKRSEEIDPNQTICPTSNVDSSIMRDEKECEDKPKPIVSKSYKMVARKSSITGKPFSPIKFLEQGSNKSEKPNKISPTVNKVSTKSKKQTKKTSLSDHEIDNSTFALNPKNYCYTSSEESVNESNDDNDNKESSESDTPKSKKTKNKKYKRITDTSKKTTSKELKELSKDSLTDLKDDSVVLGNEKPSKRRLKLLSMWSGPKKHRMASLNAIAKVHCLYENESRTHMELGLMKTIDRQVIPSTSKPAPAKKKESKPKEIQKPESTSESEYESKQEKKEDSSDSSDDTPPQRTLRGVPRSAGKYWDPKSSTSSSEDSELETKMKIINSEKKKTVPKASSNKSDSDKPPAKMKKTAGVPVKKKRNRNEVVMDLKDMVVQKRMASLNATAILAASYEKRSSKSSKDDTTSDSCSDESFSQKTKNGVGSGVKSEIKNEEPKSECDESTSADKKQKVEVIVNQDTDVTITGVYSTHLHEGFCTVSGMQYRISATSHTQTTATANCEKEGCSREDGARYTPLTALSSMQPPAEHAHSHPHPVPEIGGLARRPGCSSAFSAPAATASHHEPGKPACRCSLCDRTPRISSYGYYQPAGPLIKETGADAERALARYHPPHYHAPHPPVLQQYGPPYYPELCYGRYYGPRGSYHMPPPQPDAPMVGVGGEPYPPPQYYGTPPCYQHSPQRIPYVEYRGCPCPLNACPKNVLIGPATGKAPTGGGPSDVQSALAPPGGAFRSKVRVSAHDAVADTHGSGKDPPLEQERPTASDAPHPCRQQMLAIGGVSPKRELYDIRDKLRIANDIPGPTEALGPPSPARGSAGACPPHPPPAAPRRARLGKDMARRSLAGDDTGLLLSIPQPLLAHHSDVDDDVLAISPPTCAPIDLSSSDERSTPLVDVKKENEGPTYATARKPDALALREHNSTTLVEAMVLTDAAKAVKRRYSRPKLEIDMNNTQLEEGCKTNGIGEHVKLQKRRKVSGDQTDIPRTETITKESKKKPTQTKRTPKTPQSDKKGTKRKLECTSAGPNPKKIILEATGETDPRLINIAAVTEEPLSTKPKHKSALLLDNLMRKNSIDRADSKGYSSDAELNPAELFLPPNENVSQNCAKKTLNINNNIVESAAPANGVRANTLAAVSQLIEKKLACKNACKVEKVDSKVVRGLKSVSKPPTVKSSPKEDQPKPVSESASIDDALHITDTNEKEIDGSQHLKNKSEILKDNNSFPNAGAPDVTLKFSKAVKSKCRAETELQPQVEESQTTADVTEAANDEDVIRTLECDKDKAEKDRTGAKRCKLANGESKAKNVEKVVKLLESKRPAIKTDEATLVVEEACASPSPSPGVGGAGRRARRRGGAARRGRRLLAPPAPLALDPNSTPRWSNGWNWDGEHYVSKVYLNNDSRLDRTARCWSRMTHRSGDSVSRGDCVLLRASLARAQPYVARVASLWENPEDGEMMVSLVWYYRPEHTELGRQPADAPDEVFASRHRDANSVACIEDKCYVLTFNEYCRYRKRLKAAQEGIRMAPSIVPPAPAAELSSAVTPNDCKLPPSVSPELVLFCRKIYDFRSKKIQVPNK